MRADVERKSPSLGEERLADMDRAGISVQVLSHTTPGTQDVAVSDARHLARSVNDVLAAAIERHPTRFAGFASLPTPDPVAALSELRRACEELGFAGAAVNGLTEGRFLDDECFRPLLREAARLGAPLHLHPGPPPKAVTQAYFSGSYSRGGVVARRRGLGWHAKAGLHVLRLVLSGALDEIPELKLIVGHLGEMLPFMLDRLDESLPIVKTGLGRSVSQTLMDHLVVTTSGFTQRGPFDLALSAFGPERLLFAIDYPYSSNEDAVAFLTASPVSGDVLAAISHGNADRLLRLPVNQRPHRGGPSDHLRAEWAETTRTEPPCTYQKRTCNHERSCSSRPLVPDAPRPGPSPSPTRCGSGMSRWTSSVSRRPHQVVELRAREECLGRGVDVDALHDFGREALDHVVIEQRAREPVRQRAGEHPVDRALGLGRAQQLRDRAFQARAHSARTHAPSRESKPMPGRRSSAPSGTRVVSMTTLASAKAAAPRSRRVSIRPALTGQCSRASSG